MARSCIFCDRTPTTRAHIFRRGWLDDLYPGRGRLTHSHQRNEPDSSFDHMWTASEADLKVNCACRQCNSTWMDQLDHDAEDLFLNLAAIGFSVRLEHMADRALLARWCALIAILFDQAQGTPSLGPSTHRAIKDRVPDETRLWLLRIEPPEWEVQAWGYPRALTLTQDSASVEAYFVTFGVGHLCVQGFIPADDAGRRVGFDRSAQAAWLKQLWPDPLVPLNWPPPRSLTWEEREKAANTFQHPEQ